MTFPFRLKVRPKLVLAAASLALAAVVVSCGGGAKRADDFQVTLFDGSGFQLSDQIGEKVVVLNFWYPSCPPCRAEMPDFEKAWQEVQGEPVQFLGLFVPQGLDTEQDARDFIAELGLTYDFATDTRARIAIDYEVKYFPTTFFIDIQGRLSKTEISTLDTDAIVTILRELDQG